MSRRRYVWHAGDWRDVTDYKRPPRKTPYLIRDTMGAAVHPATGEVLDSKSAFRAVTRAHGLVELGNDAPAAAPVGPQPGDIARDVAEAIQMLEQGYTPPPVEVADAETRIYN